MQEMCFCDLQMDKWQVANVLHQSDDNDSNFVYVIKAEFTRFKALGA